MLMNTHDIIQDFTERPRQKFYFIRHGETDWNKQGILMGQMDIPLNETGLQQAQQAALIVNNHEYGLIFSSSLQRAFVTAQIITKSQARPIQVLHGLKERGFPSGMLHDDLEHITTDNLTGNYEKWSDFSSRVMTSLDYVMSQKHQLPPLIIAHGGVLVAICQALNVTMPTIANCQPLEFWQDEQGFWQVKLCANNI